MKLSFLLDFNLSDAGITRNVKPILDKLGITEANVILDFCDCGVDYPAASLLIDRVLSEIKKLEGDKILQIVFDFKIHELAIHKWFFLGSSFFEIKEDDNHLTLEQIKKIISEKLTVEKIILEIVILNDDKTQSNLITYGTN